MNENSGGKGAESKSKIVMIALELFAQKGYAATSVNTIAKKAGVSKGLIYHYFNSKQEVLEAIFTHFLAEGEQAFDSSQDIEPKAFIKNMIEYSFQYIINKTKLNRLLIGLTIQPEVTDGLKEQLDQSKALWMNQITGMFESLGYKDAEEETYLLGAILDGVGLGYIALGEEYPIHKIKNLIFKKYQL